MSNLTQTELAKVRKAALLSVSLSSELKTSAVDSKLRELSSEIKKVLAKKDMMLEILITRSTNS